MVATNPEMVLANQYLQKFLNRLHPDGERFEIRILFRDQRAPHHKVFDSVAPAVSWIRDQEERLGDSVQGFYTTLNPLRETTVGATKDTDVSARRCILIDIHAERPVKTSSTDEEKASALGVIDRLAEKYLVGERKWPKPLAIDSSNGFHGLYELADDFPLNKAGDQLIKSFLQALDRKFSTTKAKVDTTVHNRSRITKLPGTWTRKGQDSDDRPWRKAALLDLGEDKTISPEAIASVIAHLTPTNIVSFPTGELDDVTKAILRKDISAQPETPKNISILEELLGHISADFEYDLWMRIVWGILSTRWSVAEDLAREWSKSAPHRYEEDAFSKLVTSYDPDSSISLGTVHFHAREGGYTGHTKQNQIPIDPAQDDESRDAIDELNREFAWDQNNMAIYNIGKARYVLKDRFLTQYGNRTITVEGSKGPKNVPLGKTWLENPRRRDIPRVVMKPGQAEPLSDGAINSWKGFVCEPAEGDVKPFTELLKWLFTDARERKYIMQWLALLVQKPEEKFNVALVIWGCTQGTGKSLLFETIAELFDDRHYAVVGQEVFTS
jgi:hypothetical protein